MKLERVIDESRAGLLDPLFREYGLWVLDRLSGDLGLQFGEEEVDKHHAAFQAELPSLLHAPGRLYLAWSEGELVGSGGLKPTPTGEAEIKRMYVRSAARRRGVARAVLERLLADARGEGFATARLESLQFMTEAHTLYRSVGFGECPVFEGSESALTGLQGVTYFMRLGL